MNKFKVFLSGLIIGISISVTIPISAQMQSIQAFFNDIKIKVNNNLIDTGEDKPFIYNGRTYVPTRYIAEGLGAKVSWNESDNSVEITQNITITPTSTPVSNNKYTYIKSVVVNGKEMKTELQPILLNKTVLVTFKDILNILSVNNNASHETKIIQFSKKDCKDKLTMTLNSKTCTFNDKIINLEVPPQILGEGINTLTYVPIKIIAESFGYSMQQDNINKTITINSIN
jgi:N-acetylmuramoyl-L-alanine amidase